MRYKLKEGFKRGSYQSWVEWGLSKKEPWRRLHSVHGGGHHWLMNERMDKHPLHVHNDPVLFDTDFFLKKGVEIQKFCKNLIQLCLLLTFKTQCFKLTLSVIFVNNLHANVVIFWKYIFLNFCNPKLIWKNRRLIFSK